MRILITGGCGFVGSNLALYIKEKYPEYEIVCLDNLKRRGSEINISRLLSNQIRFEHGDIRNKEDLDSIGEFDFLIECSAEPSVQAGYDGNTCYLIDTNLTGTVNCLEVAKKYKSNIIFLSTSRVYPIESLQKLSLEETEFRFEIPETAYGQGWDKNGIKENFPTNGIRSLYGTTKLCSEMLVQEYASIYGFNTVINRFGVIAGPWQMGKVDQGFVSLWLSHHIFKDMKNLSYMGFGGSGFQVRDVLNIKDLCELISLQMNSITTINGHIFNVGGGLENSVSLKELTLKCKKYTGNSINIDSKPETKSYDIPYYVTNNSLISETLNWKPKYSIDDTVIQIKDWMIEYYADLKHIFK